MKETTYCSDVLLNFIKQVSKKFDSIGESSNAFRRELPAVLKGMRVGRMIFTVAMPPPGAVLQGKPQGGPPGEGAPQQRLIPSQAMQRILQQSPTVERIVLYENDIGQVGTDTITARLTSDVGMDMEVTVYADPDYTFTEHERSYLNFLMQMVFHVIGRMQVMGLMELARVTEAVVGIPNAVGLKNFMARTVAMHEQGGYTSVFMNFKNFKYINQRVGMQTGNLILRYFALSMQRLIEKDEEIVARLGGDNFFLFIKDEHLDEFERVLRNFMLEFEEGENTLAIRLEVRMGIYKVGPNDKVIDIMDNANTAMVQTREPDKPIHIRFHPQMKEREIGKKELSVVFPSALQNGEFVVYYQPKIDIAGRRMFGAEALVRWERNGIVVSSKDFVPVLERDGSVHMLDFSVFEGLCRDQAEWRDKGLEPVKIYANFSRQHLLDRDCTNHILRIMKEYNIPSELVAIEMSETSSVVDYERMVEFVGEMNRCGIPVSIDNFGTGYSSISLLKDMKVESIKLDPAFLQSVKKAKPSDTIVLKNIISMADALGITVIGEGVETKEQADFLEKINCRIAQGFWYDKPLPHDLFEERLADKDYYKNIAEK
ncbi:EAL domain-containing protein [Schwartzia sp. (in: firmicutes)]